MVKMYRRGIFEFYTKKETQILQLRSLLRKDVPIMCTNKKYKNDAFNELKTTLSYDNKQSVISVDSSRYKY